MKCYNCGGNLLEKSGVLQIPSDTIRSYQVENADYSLCASCGEIILSNETWRKAEQIESKQIKKLIGNMPITDFVGAKKAADLLGMSRQALHKHRRIKRGFVYFYTFEDKIFYHLESLMLFKETGDGRFNLASKTSSSEKEYVLVTLPMLPAKNSFTTQTGKEPINIWKKSRYLAKGKRYAIR